MGNDTGGQAFFNAPIPNKTWAHITIERISGTLYLYIDGNLTASKAGYNANYDTSDPLWIGRQQNSYLNAYVDEFRISKIARWKTNFTPPYNEYRGTLETIYPDINPDSTFRYKTDPTGSAYIDNVSNGGTRNRTLQIQNITNTSYVVGEFIFDPTFGYVKSVQLNTSYYASGMTLISSSIDNTNGLIEFNISKPTGFSPGTDRASILDYTIAYVNYTDGSVPVTSYFGYGYLINGTTDKTYGVHNFLGTPVTYGDWNFTANFTANNLTTQVGIPVQFVSTFNGSYPNRWRWDFGDGNIDDGTNSTVTHAYATTGFKTVTLTEYLWQNNSINNTIMKTNYIQIGDPPVTDFVMSNMTGLYQIILRLYDTSTNSPIAWNWSIDGGNFADIQNPLYVLTGEGNYTITLIATNVVGSNSTTKYANVSNFSALPITNFTMNNSVGFIPLSVQFTDDSSGSNPILEWNWSFGDLPGNYSNISNPIYTFTRGGIYNVTLYTRNIFGTNVTWHYVTSIEQPVANFTMSNTSTNTPLVINFTDDSAYVPTSWNWSFGEGNYSEAQNPTYIFNYMGNYTVTLIATNSAGSNTTSNTVNASENLPPIANFLINNTSGTSPLIVNFTDASINIPTSWNWSFGDGVYSDAQNPIYTFIPLGNYTITLIVTNGMGNSSITKYVEVTWTANCKFHNKCSRRS